MKIVIVFLVNQLYLDLNCFIITLKSRFIMKISLIKVDLIKNITELLTILCNTVESYSICAPPAQNFLIFMQFSGTIDQIIGWRPPLWGWRTPIWEILDPPLFTVTGLNEQSKSSYRYR